jgi:hypothetical protein
MQTKAGQQDDRVNYRDPNKATLEVIGKHLGHDSLSTTIREATAEYIARRIPLLKRSVA